MVHFECRDCGNELSCPEIIYLFRNRIACDRNSGEYWCPICFLKHHDARRRVEGLLAGLKCRPCAGPAGTTALQDSLDEYGADLIAATPGYSYATLDRDYNVVMQVMPGAPAGPTPRASGIKLEPGEVRCYCNNCERLRFQA
jgi:hypothetical protein